MVCAAFQAFLQLCGVGLLGGEELAQVKRGGEPLLLRLAVGGLGAVPT